MQLMGHRVQDRVKHGQKFPDRCLKYFGVYIMKQAVWIYDCGVILSLVTPVGLIDKIFEQDGNEG